MFLLWSYTGEFRGAYQVTILYELNKMKKKHIVRYQSRTVVHWDLFFFIERQKDQTMLTVVFTISKDKWSVYSCTLYTHSTLLEKIKTI